MPWCFLLATRRHSFGLLSLFWFVFPSFSLLVVSRGDQKQGPILCLAAFESRACAGSTDCTVSLFCFVVIAAVDRYHPCTMIFLSLFFVFLAEMELPRHFCFCCVLCAHTALFLLLAVAVAVALATTIAIPVFREALDDGRCQCVLYFRALCLDCRAEVCDVVLSRVFELCARLVRQSSKCWPSFSVTNRCRPRPRCRR